MNKLKTFTEYHKFAQSRRTLIESKVNNWLNDNPNIKVITTNITCSTEDNITYAILYKEIDNDELLSLDDLEVVDLSKIDLDLGDSELADTNDE